MKKDNVIVEKSYAFAVRVVKHSQAFRPTGATYRSEGQRPGHRDPNLQAWVAPADVCMIHAATISSELDRPFRALISLSRKPRALPWAAIVRAVCAKIPKPFAPQGQPTVAKGNALDTQTQTQTFKRGLLQQMFV